MKNKKFGIVVINDDFFLNFWQKLTEILSKALFRRWTI